MLAEDVNVGQENRVVTLSNSVVTSLGFHPNFLQVLRGANTGYTIGTEQRISASFE